MHKFEYIYYLTLCVGERVDVILNANQNSGYYWIHVRGLGECAEKEIYQLAILAYEDSSKSSLSSYPGYFFGASRSVVSTKNFTKSTI